MESQQADYKFELSLETSDLVRLSQNLKRKKFFSDAVQCEDPGLKPQCCKQNRTIVCVSLESVWCVMAWVALLVP